MTQIHAPGHGERVYIFPQDQLFRFVEDSRLIEDKLKAKAAGVGRANRFDILFRHLESHENLKGRVLTILNRVEGDSDAFKATLDTMAYARRRDSQPSLSGFEFTLQELEACIKGGSLPIGQMQGLLEVGVVFDEVAHSNVKGRWIEVERNWMNGGERSLNRDEFHIKFPEKERLCEELLVMGVHSVHFSGGDVPIAEAGERLLHGVYASRIRSHRAKERHAERLLTVGDW